MTAKRTNLPRIAVEAIFKASTLLIYEALKEGHEVNIAGFGKFYIHNTKASMGVNPRNAKEPMWRAGGKTPKFTAGEAFKKAIK